MWIKEPKGEEIVFFFSTKFCSSWRMIFLSLIAYEGCSLTKWSLLSINDLYLYGTNYSLLKWSLGNQLFLPCNSALGCLYLWYHSIGPFALFPTPWAPLTWNFIRALSLAFFLGVLCESTMQEIYNSFLV